MTPKQEQQKFNQLEQQAKQGLVGALAAGEALLELHTSGLWRLSGCTTWASYASSLGISSHYSYTLMNASACHAMLAKTFDRLPRNSRICIKLLTLTTDKQRVATWKQVLAKCPANKPITAAIVGKFVDARLPDPPKRTTPRWRRLVAFNKLKCAADARDWKQLDACIEEFFDLL